MRIYSRKQASRADIKASIARYFFNVLTDTNYFNEDGTINATPIDGYNTIVCQHAQYSPKIQSCSLYMTADEQIGNLTPQGFTKEIEQLLERFIRQNITFVRDRIRGSYGTSGWISKSMLSNVLLNKMTDISRYGTAYLTRDSIQPQYRKINNMLLLGVVIIDTCDFYSEEVQYPVYESPELPMSGDILYVDKQCPIPLMFNMFTGFTQEIFYYLVMTDMLSAKTHNLLKELQAPIAGAHKTYCSNHCRHSCMCDVLPQFYVNQRPIFPLGTHLPNHTTNSAYYKRTGKLATATSAAVGKFGPDIVAQHLAKTCSVAGRYLYALNNIKADWVKWGTFSFMKHNAQNDLSDYFQTHDEQKDDPNSADGADDKLDGTQDTANINLIDSATVKNLRCTLSGQPLFDDCYLITITELSSKCTAKMLLCPFIVHHTGLMLIESKYKITIERTCVPVTFSDILAVYYADENPIYRNIMHAAYYDKCVVNTDHLIFGDKYLVSNTGYFTKFQHAILC